MPKDPIRQAAGRIGGLTKASRYGPEELTGPARRAFLASFAEKVDPDGVLPEEERARRAEAAMRAHFARLALKSVKARQAKAS